MGTVNKKNEAMPVCNARLLFPNDVLILKIEEGYSLVTDPCTPRKERVSVWVNTQPWFGDASLPWRPRKSVDPAAHSEWIERAQEYASRLKAEIFRS